MKLVVREMKMSVTFQNPLSFYKELNSTVEETSSEFTFDVILDEHKVSNVLFTHHKYDTKCLPTFAFLMIKLKQDLFIFEDATFM